MADFIIAFKRTGKTESGYSNNPLDAGKLTYAGIAQGENPKWVGFDLIEAWLTTHATPHNGYMFTEDEIPGLSADVTAFYKKQEWDVLRCDEIEAQDTANNLYDTAVNQGIETALHFMQDTLSLEHTDVMDDYTLKIINEN